MMNNIDQKLKSIIIQNSRKVISESDIDDNSNLTTDFGFDSVNVVQMIVDLETEFDISMDDEDIDLDVLTKYKPLKGLILKKIGI